MGKNKILAGAVFLGISSFISRFLGVFRDHIFADRFGALQGEGIFDLDVYYAAFRLPDLLFNLLILGTVSAAFVPIFTGYIAKKQKEKGWEFVNSILHILLLGLFVIAGLCFVFAPWLVKLIAPGFSGEKLQITVNLTRIMLVSPIFFSLSSIAQSIQNTFKTFFYYALAPIFYNLSIITAALLWGEKWGVYGVALGVVIGAALHFLIQVPALIKLGYRYRFVMDWRRKDVREMAKLTLPRIFGMSAMQFTLLIDTLIGSTLAVGSITVLNYAINLNSLPMGVIGVSLAISSFSTLSELAALKKQKEFRDELRKLIRWILFLIIPASLGLFVLRVEVVSLVLKGGKFGEQDVWMTAGTLGLLVLSLLAQSLIPLFARAFYAWKNTWIPVKIALLAFGLNVIGSVTFAKILGLGVYGLALANTGANWVNFGFLLWFLRKKIGGFWPKQAFFDFLGASMLMTVGVVWVKARWLIHWGNPEQWWGWLGMISVLILLATVIYVAVLLFLKNEEVRGLLKKLKLF